MKFKHNSLRVVKCVLREVCTDVSYDAATSDLEVYHDSLSSQKAVNSVVIDV